MMSARLSRFWFSVLKRFTINTHRYFKPSTSIQQTNASHLSNQNNISKKADKFTYYVAVRPIDANVYDEDTMFCFIDKQFRNL